MKLEATMKVAAAFAVAVVLNGVAMAEYDFASAWKDVEIAQRKELPRTVTNKVDEIEREAIAVARWPDAARAFLLREQAMGVLRDEDASGWLPALAASVDSKPAPLQAVLQLHLAHTYLENSRRMRLFGSAPTKLDDEAAADNMPPWSPERIADTLESQFAKVFAFENELKGMSLADWEVLFDKGTLPESYCPTLYDFAVRDAIAFYGETIPDKTLEKGLAIYGRLIDFHKNDGNVDALAAAEIAAAEYVRDFDGKPQRDRDAVFESFIDEFIKRYDGKSEVALFAVAKKADILRGRKDLVAAHDLAAEYAAKSPKSIGGKLCGNIVSEIESKELAVDVERNWCVPWPDMKVRLRNLAKVHFRLVPVSFEDLVADRTMGEGFYCSSDGRYAMRSKYLNREGAREWSRTLPLEPDYSEQTFEFQVPQDIPSGHYVLYAAPSGSFDENVAPLFAQYVTVTSLALALENGNGAFGGTVYRAESGEPVAGAQVELWGYPKTGGRFEKLLESYVTDIYGHFAADVTKGVNGVLNCHVRVVKDGEEVLSLGREASGFMYDEKESLDHIELFTDRSLYRPGQEIKVKGIVYHADPQARDFRTLPGETVKVELSDPNGKEVATRSIKSNKWGSFVCDFVAPSDRLTGGYGVRARVVLENGDVGETRKYVNIEEYKRPKFTTEIEEVSDKATLGAPVTVVGKALTYSGLPVQDAKVEWHVERSTRYPDWWSRLGFGERDDGDNFVAKGESRTDENGAFNVVFTPEASPTADLSGDPSFDFTITVSVTDGTGETRTASESFEIGTVAWRASVWTEGDWHEAGKGIAAKVALRSLAGTEVPVNGLLKVFRLKAPDKPVRKPAGSGRYGYDDEREGPWKYEAWEVGDEVVSLNANSDKSETWMTELKLGVGAYRMVFEAIDPNGRTVKDFDNFCVFDAAADSLGLNIPDFCRVEKNTVKVGDVMRVYWGTGYDTGYCRVKVKNNGKTLLDSVVSGESPKWLYELPVGDEHRGEIRVETTFVRENRIYHDHCTVNVPWDNKKLDIAVEHLTKRLYPGKEETWKFKVSGPAEVLAFMYDRSLDEYRWHDVALGFSRHFTLWPRYIGSPIIQNSTVWLSAIGGSFKNGFHHAVDVTWPFWRALPNPMLRSRRMTKGFATAACGGALIGGDEDCLMECEVCEEPDSAENGVMMEKMRARAPIASEDDGPQEMESHRRNLRETAFFFPDLETDADGNVSFTFTAPDALTGWKFLMVAHDNALNGGVYRNEEIVTAKPLMCEPNAPRFAREGDDFIFAVKVTNTEDAPQKGEVSLQLEELDAAAASRGKFPQPPSQAFELKPHESKTFGFSVAIPDGCGYLKYVAKAKGESFADGEEGVLPVLARRMFVREAVQLNARGGETKSFRLENLVSSGGSDTIRHQDLTVRVVSNPAWYAVLSLPYLMEFPHECCEQTFSRFYANALCSYIANSDPRIRATFDVWKAAGAEALKSPLETNPHLKAIALERTPWIRDMEHEKAARARLGALFGEDSLKGEQTRCIEKLRVARNADGRWPWFPGGPSSDGITLYILTGFARLRHLTGLDHPDFFESALESLDYEVSDSVKVRLLKENLPFRINGFDVRWLYLHSFAGVASAKDKTLAPLFVDHLRESWMDLGLESQALAAIALKRMGEDELSLEIMASIKERGIVSDELGMYWKRPSIFSSSVFAAPVSTQALIVEAFREVTGDEEAADACNVWILKQNQTQDWTTTAATADAIYALLLGGGTDLLADDSLAGVKLGGEKVAPESVESGTGMWSVRFAADAIKPEMGEIAFTGSGGKGVSWGGVHWSYFEDVLKVRAHEPKELRVEKKYYKKVTGPEGTRLASIDGALEQGDEIVARLEIESDRSLEFVHISDERPACAEPVDVLSSYRWCDGVGYYQSTRDTATHYYIDRLNKGAFVLETSFRVQHKGEFSGGVATIQCMYAPEFTAHSSADKMRCAK